MKTTLYRAETLRPFDLQGTEAHLTAMAAQGWRLEYIGRFFWKYRKAEPARVHYAVAAPPAAGENGDLGEQLYFQELCSAAGWEKVCDWAAVQVYANESEAPIPLETDGALRLETVHQSMRRTYLRDCRNSLVSQLFLLLLWFANLLAHPRSFLLSNVALGVSLSCVVAASVNAFSIAGYFSWRRRSFRLTEEGGGLAAVPRFYRTASRLSDIVLLLLAVFLFSLAFQREGVQTAPYAAIGVGVSVLTAALIWGVNRFLQKRSCDGSTRAAAIILTMLALLAALSGLAGALNLSERIHSPGPEGPSYAWNGEIWDLEPRALPLTVEDLTGYAWPHVRRNVHSVGRTLFGSETAYTELAAQEDGTEAYVHYNVIDVSNGHIRRAIVDDVLNGPSFLEYQPEDPAPWGAEAAYRLYYPDGRAVDEWLISWPGRVVAIRAEGVRFQPMQMATVSFCLSPSPKEGRS